MTKPTAKIAAVFSSCAVASPLGKKIVREIEREGGIDVPVEPFDEVAGLPADDVAEAAAPRARDRLRHGLRARARRRRCRRSRKG